MRETNFIKQNKEKWKRFERMLKFKQNDPEKLSKLFIQITDDLSYSRTFYPNRSVRVYLNNLAQQIFYSIYKSKKAKRGSLFRFWSEELPQLMYEARRELLLSFTIFTLAVIIGAFSCAMNPEFPRVILGDRYVEMTLENIESGDPMAVYKQMNEVDMSLGITLNNLRVGFNTFISGLFLGLGTIGVLIYNGIMVGAFQFFFYEQGELRESFLTIWIHGTIEISTIILAGCAGLTLGKGLVFPGTYSRLQSLQKHGLRALKIMLGIIPLIILAGFIEGFVTRYTDAPDILRLGIILASLSFILLYFVWYPFQKFKEGARDAIKDIRIPPSKALTINYNEIKSTADIFMETFRLYAQNFSTIFRTAFLLAVGYTIILALRYEVDLGNIVYFDRSYNFWGMFENIGKNFGQFFNYDRIPPLGLLNTLAFGTMIYISSIAFIKASADNPKLKMRQHIIGWLGAIGVWGIYNLLFIGVDGVVIQFRRVLGISLPFMLMWLIVMMKEQKNPFTALGRSFSLVQSGFWKMYGVFFIMLLMTGLFSLLFSSPILWFSIEMIGLNFAYEADVMAAIFSGLITFIFSLFLCLIFPIFVLSSGLLFVSLREIRDADNLRERIKMIGVRKRAYGLEQER